MAFVVRLLVVEDDDTETKTWHNTIEIHNSEPDNHGFAIEANYAKSLQAAQDLIAIKDFDAAVVDIRLEQPDMNGPNRDGNDVVESLLDSELAVVAVFTGEIGQVSVPNWAKPMVSTFRKGADDEAEEGTQAVMVWLRQQAPMIQSIRQAQLKIKKEMVQLFTRSIWPRWSHWMQKDDPEGHLESALSRHLASHVHAALLEDSKQRVHPEEWYFIPPIRSGIRTGDLVRNAKGELEIVVTPRCDLATEKMETIQLAQCKVVLDEWEKRVGKIVQARAELEANEDRKKEADLAKRVGDAENSLRNYTQHAGNRASVHFLPAMKLRDGTSLGPFMVQFDRIRSVPVSAQEEIAMLTGNRIASVTSEFLPSLIERLGGFFSRIGTPDYSHSD